MVITHDIDILTLTELNKRWSAIAEEHTIWSAISKWKEHTRTYAVYNRIDLGLSERLFRGTAISIFNDNIFHTQEKGTDHRGWGRWNWVELQGKNNMNTTIISAYCPCISNSPKSVWSQHLYAMNDIDLEEPDINPRQLFWSDLSNLIKEKQADGKPIILMGDFNSDFNDLQD